MDIKPWKNFLSPVSQAKEASDDGKLTHCTILILEKKRHIKMSNPPFWFGSKV
jgi:hypothetical protein